MSGEGPTTNVSQLLTGDRSVPGRSPDAAREPADEAEPAGAAQASGVATIRSGTASANLRLAIPPAPSIGVTG